MRILLTIFDLRHRGGTQLYVRDMALELKRRGHSPAVYAAVVGSVAEEMLSAGIPVTANLRALREPPDVIHGNVRRETMSALLHFPSAPALFVCHNHTSWDSRTPLHPRIYRYLGVSRLCVDRLRAEGVPNDKISLSFNTVDVNRFCPRPALPERPRRALVFSNYAASGTHLPAVQEACRRAGIELDVAGAGAGKAVDNPEDILGRYDLVFAKAKAAIEAMAVGTAVVLCDFGGVGPMVTAENIDRLRPMNFGYEALTEPLTPENVLRQIELFDASDAGYVRDLVRSRSSLTHAAGELLDMYADVIAEHGNRAPSANFGWRARAGLARDTVLERLAARWRGLPPSTRDRVAALRYVRAFKTGLSGTISKSRFWPGR